MNTTHTSEDRQFRMTPAERADWEENGYFVRQGVFTDAENDVLRHAADAIAAGERPFPETNIDQNALVRDGKAEATGIHAMHKIHHVSCYRPEFLARVRDPRLTDPIVDILGPDLLGLNNLYIWKAPKIGLGFPWHQDKWSFNHQYKTGMTVATWTAIDSADEANGCLYVIPGSHKQGVRDHDDLEGSQQNEFKRARGARDADGIPVEVPAGSVIWFNSQVLHKSTDNHSDRFRRANVAHYISATAERTPAKRRRVTRPVMWIQGRIHPGKMDPVHRDVLPIDA